MTAILARHEGAREMRQEATLDEAPHDAILARHEQIRHEQQTRHPGHLLSH